MPHYKQSFSKHLITKLYSQIPPKKDSQLAKRKKIKLKSVMDTLTEYGLDPIKELVKLVQSGRIDDEMKTRVYLELTNYCHAKKKAVELSGDPEKPVQMKVDATLSADEAYFRMINK